MVRLAKLLSVGTEDSWENTKGRGLGVKVHPHEMNITSITDTASVGVAREEARGRVEVW